MPVCRNSDTLSITGHGVSSPSSQSQAIGGNNETVILGLRSTEPFGAIICFETFAARNVLSLCVQTRTASYSINWPVLVDTLACSKTSLEDDVLNVYRDRGHVQVHDAVR